jgi:hypothetical protein
MSNIHARTLNLPTRLVERSALCAFRCAAIEALILVIAAFAAAQDQTAAAAIVEVRVQISWSMERSGGHPLVALVTLEPLDRIGAPQNLRISESSTSVVRIAAGRYQLITTSPVVIKGQAYGWSIELPLVAPVNYIQLSQENAIRLNVGDVIETAVPNLSVAPATPAASRIATDDARVEITALLDRWITSLKSRNLKAQMSCYAPRLATYNGKRNVSREQVRAQKRKLFRLYTQIRRLELSDIDLGIGPAHATATALERWNFSNDEVQWQGRALVDFGFEKTNSRWAINSEQKRPVPVR